MFDYDKWQEIFNSIQRHKSRTILTALGVFWGIFMLVILLGAGTGLENGVRYQFRDSAINSLWIRRGQTSMPFNGLPEGRRIQFDNDDYDFLKATFPEIEHLTGRFYLPGDQLTSYQGEPLSYPVRSVHPGHLFVERSEITAGRFINEQDVAKKRKVAVIGGTVVKDLFGEEDPIGKDIKMGNAIYKVVGAFFDSGGEYEMRVIYVPISTAQQIFGGTRDIHQLMLTTGNLSLPQMKQLEEEIRLAFARRKQFDPADERALWISNIAEEYQNFQNLFGAIKFFVWLVGIGSIIAGVIGVSNIMLIIVKDRTREIGVRKAMGATPRSIISMILQEALVITSIAGYLGMVFGILLISGMESMDVDYFKHPEVNLGVVIGAVFVLILSGTLAGLMPALQAARIHPVEAMRQ